MREKPKCARCGDTWFMREKERLCTDCARWVSKLHADARATDVEAWGTQERAPKVRMDDDEPASAWTPVGDAAPFRFSRRR